MHRRATRLTARIRGVGDWVGVRVLGYHRVDDVRGDALTVSPDRFAAQMEAILASGAKPIRLVDALDLLTGTVEEQYVAVTFDDGYRDIADRVEPLLRQLGVPATVFVPTSVASGDAGFFWYDAPPPALDWAAIERLANGGVIDFQSHTRTHPWLPRLSEERAREEIAGSKEELERRLGLPVTTLAYPAGLYGEREERLVRECGYRAGVTTDPGVNPGGGVPGRIHRTLVYGGDGEQEFADKLTGVFDRPSRLRGYFFARRAAGAENEAYGQLS